MSTAFTAPRATWAVTRLIWMQILISIAVILESAVLNGHGVFSHFALSYGGIAKGYLWQPLTTVLIDLDPVSLLFNVLGLWMFGSELEQRWGRSVFIRFFALCSLGSTGAFLLLCFLFPGLREFLVYITPTGPLLGLFLAYAVYWPDRQVWLMFIFPVRVKYVLLIIGLIEIIYPLLRNINPIIVGGHLGGLVVAGLVLLISGGEPARLDQPFRRLTETLGRLAFRRGKKSAAKIAGGENLENRIDAILDKISRGGMKSLSNEEKQFLRDASDRMNKTKH
jgi:membrane associated rhomboid family serine protease